MYKVSIYNLIRLSLIILLYSPTLINNSFINKTDQPAEQYHVLFPNETLTNSTRYDYSYGPCRYDSNCFLPYGICLNSTSCMCMPDFAHLYVEGQSLKELKCSYEKKRILVAGLLEFFLPFGLGHFYSGHVFFGLIKLIYYFILYFFCCFVYCKGTNDDVFIKLSLICLVMCCIVPLWNIFDLFWFFSGNYNDGNGVPLA